MKIENLKYGISKLYSNNFTKPKTSGAARTRKDARTLDPHFC